jgi:uridine phosphorylase
VSVVRLPIGAPAVASNSSCATVAGARTLIAVGAAGSLQERAPVGACVLPTSAIREEGTSYHYRPPAVEALPDSAALEALRATCSASGVIAHEGRAWTTDAPYRELSSKVRRFAEAGVLAVDMEASALFVVGPMRGVRVASLFIVSDELFHPWRPAFYDRGYRDAALRIASCALDGLTRMSG